MKNLILIIFIAIPILLFGQDKIYNATELKKGLYKTYDEFINNTPSITNEFSVKNRSTVTGGSPFDFEIKDGTKVGNVFGFCDGKDVYFKGLRNGGYCKADYVGRYSFFNYVGNSAEPDQFFSSEGDHQYTLITSRLRL